VATSLVGAIAFLERRVADLRIAMFLELFTVAGAVAGGLIAFTLDEQFLAALFALLLLYVAFTMVRGVFRRDSAAGGDVMTADAAPPPRNLALGAAGGLFGGVISAILGVGGGIVMVPVIHLGLGLPLRVAAATSTVMIAVTAAASGIVYLVRGAIDPYVLGPTAVGVFLGALVGSRSANRIDLRVLRLLFVFVLSYTAILMATRAVAPT
jgi:hypothetical protein